MKDDERKTEDTAQTVDADTDAGAEGVKAEDKESTAQDETSLDEILKEFETKDEREAPKSEPTKPETSADASELAEIKAQLEALNKRNARDSLGKVVQAIKGNADVEDDFVEAFLDAKARKDPRILKAYQERENNPRAWGKVETELGKEIQKQFGVKVDKQATESRDAVSAAVRGSSAAARKDDQVGSDEILNMSDEDFSEWERKHGVMPG